MSQSLSAVYIHAVFSTKERRACLSDPQIRTELYSYMAAILRNLQCPPILIGGCADHVHGLFLLSRTCTVANVFADIKRESSKWIKTKGPAYDMFQWQSGYGAFSVSQSNLVRVQQYILDQDRHHAKHTFQEEFRALLRRHNVEFDERYIWD